MNDFIAFARAHGLVMEHVIADGRVHRVATEDKPRSRNGAYLANPDGQGGFVQNWATHERPIVFRSNKAVDPIVMTDRRVSDRLEQDRKHQEAARQAQQVIARCSYGPHRYLGSKGLYSEQALIDPEPVRMPDGSTESGCIVIPMRNFRSGSVQSVQWIGEKGKKYLAGGQARGAVHALGPRDAQTVWLCEGAATGLSALAAIKSLYRQDKVLVTFSAGNLAYVAPLMRGRAFVIADHDTSGTGQRVAKESGLPSVMSPVEGEDINDMAQRAGIRAVADLMRGLL